jgi:hypothetical protein
VKDTFADGLGGVIVTVIGTVALADGRIAQTTTTASNTVTTSFCQNLTLTTKTKVNLVESLFMGYLVA